MSERPAIRVLQWNLWTYPDIDSRIAHLAEVIANENPDVVTFQESSASSDGHALEDLLAEATGMTAVVAPQSPGYPNRYRQGLLTRLPITSSSSALLPEHSWGHPTWRTFLASAHLRSASGRSWHVGSAHLAWGGTFESARLKQAQFIEAQFADDTDPDEVAVLGGDFNCVPDSDTLRYLTGRHAAGDHGAYWLDAWAVAGHGDGTTSGPQNANCLATADRFLIDPTMLPSRRLDYVMVRGWAWGNPGMPLDVRVVGEQGSVALGRSHPASDHLAVVADLWDPPLPATA